ncbi:MAG: zinc-binding alcohol dehydrogenase family protein [Candidatus Acidiferrales bacterium]
MRALIIRKPGVASIETVAEPKLDPGEVLLRVRMVGLCGTDLNSYRGRNSMVQFPRIPGHEIAATIVEGNCTLPGLANGVNVTVSPYTNCGKCAACLRGRPNACAFNETLGVQRDGALTEYITVAPERLYTAPLTIKELCLVEPLTVGFHAVSRGRVTSADKVAVFGCGGVGLGAIVAAHFAGATVIAIDVEDAKLQIAKKSGATHLVNSAKVPLHRQLLEFTDGNGPDVIIEAAGNPDTFRAAVEEVAFTGRVVYIGYAKEPVVYETRLFVQKELDILGSRNALPADFRKVIEMLQQGEFPVQEAVDSIVSLDEAPGILETWSANPSKLTKIMVQLD